MLYIGNTRYRVYSGRDRVSIESPEKLDLVIKNTLLPSGLELYESLKSDGNCYIDTKFVPTGDNHRVSTKINIASINTTSILGCLNSTPLLVLGFNGAIWVASSTNSTNRNKTVLSSGISIVDFTTNNDTVNYTVNNTSGTYSAGTDLSAINKSIFLFANNNRPSRQYSSDTIFYFRFYELGILVRNMIPCTYYGEPGMWDVVESKFYGNSGSGEFTLGNKIVLREYEYLENVSNSYINLEYVPTNTTGVKIEASPNKVKSALILLGRGYADNNTRWWLNFTSSSLSLGWNEAYTTISYLANTWYKIEHNYLNSRTNSVNNVVANYLYPNLTLTSASILLFTNATNPSDYVFTGKVKYLYITEGDQIVRNFVPCTYNGIPGMWDKIELKFYGSSNNGIFIVNNEIKFYDYLENNGEAYIDTDYCLTSDNVRCLWCAEDYGTTGSSLFGAEQTSNNKYTFVLYESSNKRKLFIGNSGFLNVNYTFGTSNDNWELVTNNNKASLSKNNTLLSTVNYNGKLNKAISIVLFGNKRISQFVQGAHLKLYYWKLYDNGTLVRDYKPCLYNNQAGLWDSVECKFYGNANNTGTLTVGNNS